MAIISRLDASAPGFEQSLEQLLRVDVEQDDAIDAAAARILREVQTHGDEALLSFTREFDRVEVQSVEQLEIPRHELEAALAHLPGKQRNALEAAAE